MTKCILVLAATASTYVSAGAPQQTIVLGNGEWEPFQSEKLKHYGVVSHIVTESFASQGVHVEFVFYPWKRNYEQAKKGKLAGTFVWSKKPERTKDFLFSDSVMQDLPVLFYLKDNPPKSWKAGNWSSLSGLRIGATIGYNYLRDFGALEDSKVLNVERVTSDLLNYRKLLAGHIDVYPASLESGFGILNANFSERDIARLATTPQMPGDYSATHFYLMISKVYPDADALIKRFNQGLKLLRDSGAYAQYFEDSRAGLYLKGAE